MAHTPGPWTIRYETNVFSADDRLVANAGGYSSNVNSDRVRAENLVNTRLIAAAPDLLASCKKLMEHIYSEFSLSGGRLATSVKADAEAAEAAIAKAEGSR